MGTYYLPISIRFPTCSLVLVSVMNFRQVDADVRYRSVIRHQILTQKYRYSSTYLVYNNYLSEMIGHCYFVVVVITTYKFIFL